MEALVMNRKFGKFSSLSAFLNAYRIANRKRILKQAVAAPPAKAARLLRKLEEEQRDVVEIKALLRVHEPDDSDKNGGKHCRLRIVVAQIMANDPDVASDLNDAKESG